MFRIRRAYGLPQLCCELPAARFQIQDYSRATSVMGFKSLLKNCRQL